jgi:hypothetical protein
MEPTSPLSFKKLQHWMTPSMSSPEADYIFPDLAVFGPPAIPTEGNFEKCLVPEGGWRMCRGCLMRRRLC